MDSNWSQNFSLFLLSPPIPNVSPSLLSLTNVFPLPVHFSFHLYSFLLTLVKFCHIMMSPLPFPQPWSLFQICFPFPWFYLINVWTLNWHDGALRRKERRGNWEQSRGGRKRGVIGTYIKIFIPTTCRPQSFVSHWPVPSYELLCTSPLPAHIFVSY